MPAAGTSKFEITDEVLVKVQALASQGLTTVQIGHVLGAAESTIYKYKKNNVEFAEAIKQGQSKGVATITNALFKSAKSGQVTSMIFWLKNRAPDEWKDRVPEGTYSDTDPPQRVEVIVKGATLADVDTTSS
jgi:hypothetical protein